MATVRQGHQVVGRQRQRKLCFAAYPGELAENVQIDQAWCVQHRSQLRHPACTLPLSLDELMRPSAVSTLTLRDSMEICADTIVGAAPVSHAMSLT
jgi:hypothetical protein